jgi:hypothetical protein
VPVDRGDNLGLPVEQDLAHRDGDGATAAREGHHAFVRREAQDVEALLVRQRAAPWAGGGAPGGRASRPRAAPQLGGERERSDGGDGERGGHAITFTMILSSNIQ